MKLNDIIKSKIKKSATIEFDNYDPKCLQSEYRVKSHTITEEEVEAMKEIPEIEKFQTLIENPGDDVTPSVHTERVADLFVEMIKKALETI